MLVPILCVVGGILLGAGIYFLITRLAAANLIKKAEEEAEANACNSKNNACSNVSSSSTSVKEMYNAASTK